jgi:hypothetical protein
VLTRALASRYAKNKKILVASQPMAPQIGKVSIQAETISSVTPNAVVKLF